MRITSGMMTDQVVFNMQRSLRRFSEMQIGMSSGRRINKPSDDPLGTLRDLDYRTALTRNSQLRQNIGQAMNWETTYDSVLADAKDFVSTAKEIAVTMANGNYDELAREASALSVQSLIDQLVQAGNTELGGRRVFSGFKTRLTPFQYSGNGLVYNGDQGQIQFEVEASTLMTVNLAGDDVFLKELSVLGQDADLNVGVVASTLLADLHLGDGIDLGSFTITDRNRDDIPLVTVDISAETTVGDVIDKINADLAAAVPPITNLVARLGDGGNNIQLVATDDGRISNSTLLSKLNGGGGVDLASGKFMVSDGAGTNVQIDVSGATTINDVITQFNAQLSAAGVNNVTAAINAGGTGLVINDTNGVPLGLSISDLNEDSRTAENLGIVGSISPSLDGEDLNPVAYFEIAENGGTAAADLGIIGSFSGDKFGDDLDPGLLDTDLTVIDLSALNNGLGFEGGSLAVHQGAASHIIDLSTLTTIQDLLDAFNNSGLDITASINASGGGIQVVNNDQAKSLVIEDASGRAAKDLGLFGSSDLIGTMIVLRNALEKDDQEGTGMLLENLDDSLMHLLNHRSTIGAKTIQLETTERRLVDLELTFTELLSEVEDADLASLVTQLATYENSYKASLISAGKIIQPSLLDFLR